MSARRELTHDERVARARALDRDCVSDEGWQLTMEQDEAENRPANVRLVGAPLSTPAEPSVSDWANPMPTTDWSRWSASNPAPSAPHAERHAVSKRRATAVDLSIVANADLELTDEEVLANWPGDSPGDDAA